MRRYIYGLSTMNAGRLIIDMHDSFTLKDVVHLRGLQSVRAGSLARLHFSMGKAVPNAQVFFGWMQQLSQNSMVSGDDFFAIFKFFYEHSRE
jgi:hypothetical protein